MIYIVELVDVIGVADGDLIGECSDETNAQIKMRDINPLFTCGALQHNNRLDCMRSFQVWHEFFTKAAVHWTLAEIEIKESTAATTLECRTSMA